MSARIHTPLARILTVATALALVFGLGSSFPGVAAPTVAASPVTVSIDCPQTTMVPYSDQNCTITVSASDAAPAGSITVTRSMLANYPYPPCTLTTSGPTSSTCPIIVGAWAGPADGSLTATYNPTDGHAPASGTISITTAYKPTLYVAVNSATKVYGEPNPTFSVSYSGFVNGDDASDLGGELAFAVAGPASLTVGGYAVSASGLTSANYNFSYTAGSLTVTPAALSISTDSFVRGVGEENPPLTGNITGVVAGDDISVTWSTSATAASPAGDYAINPTLVDPDGLATNYTITSSSGVLRVAPDVDLSLADATFGDPAIQLPQFDTWGRTLSYAASGACSNDLRILSYTAAGECVVSATALDSPDYAGSGPFDFSLDVAPAIPVLSWDLMGMTIRAGAALDGSVLNATASFNGSPVAGSFAYDIPDPLTAGTHTLTAVFTPDSANFTGGGTVSTQLTVLSNAIDVAPLDQTLSVVAGTPYTLTAGVSDCAVQCEFIWYVDGEQVAHEWLVNPDFSTGNYFDPSMDMTFTYAAGEHDVRLDVRDGEGYQWSSVFALSVAASNDPVVTPPTAPIDSSPIVAPTDQDDAAAAAAEAAAKAAAASKAAAAASLPNTSMSLPQSSGSWPWLTLIGLVGLFGAGAIAEGRRRHRARSGASAAS